MRDRLKAALNVEETEDIEPPFRCIPVGNPVWFDLKTKRILSLITERIKEVDVECPEYVSMGKRPIFKDGVESCRQAILKEVEK